MNLLTAPAPSMVAVAGFTALVVAVAGLAVLGVASAARACGRDEADASSLRLRGAAGLATWLALTGGLAASGALSDFSRVPPPVMPLIALSVVSSTALALSRFGRVLAEGLPMAALVGFQAFRIPLELLLLRLCLDGVLPVQMTFEGMNWDIATGVLAVPLAMWAAWGRPPRALVAAWNVLGLLLLLTIVTIAALSTPGPLRAFVNEPANTIIATFPFVWLPTVLVQAAWIGHLLVFRRLRLGGD